MSFRHRVLIIGTGSIGVRHLRCFQATGRAEMSICEALPDRRREVAEQFGVAHACADIEEAIRAARPTMAVVASPAPSHIPLALQLAEAGVHLLIEKPLSLTLTDADRLLAVVQQRGLTAGVAYCWRYHPLIAAAQQFLASQPFGRVLEIVCQTGQCFPFYRPAYRDIYYNDRATGGGAIQDALTHMLNTGEWIAGPIQRLGADAGHQQLEGVTVEDTVHVITRQGRASDVMGSYSLNQYQPANEVNWSIVCERGVVRIEVAKHRWMQQNDPAAAWEIHTIPPPDRDTMYKAQAEGFLDAVEQQAPPRCTLADGLQTLRVNLAVLAAVDSGRSLAAVT
ncbi:Gfo/Idh/MocA family protein [Lignipirellula cremea]|uniref:4-carboxy-2-hydroxymuconate-6-semialdehyde dehydrogenase n=1 Tax=Lignipirellula cremea TaxID=2528010 RepID=A0A518DUS6_9BACT|nr:Gfo/Idh/MocA family oxidoreductase [Lignipirellula cremea]QDU95592.1 4-carboxy-2-hydroxymuconate-6-semialdehyde dehydrogenase [Lignipirellula cremea]